MDDSKTIPATTSPTAPQDHLSSRSSKFRFKSQKRKHEDDPVDLLHRAQRSHHSTRDRSRSPETSRRHHHRHRSSRHKSRSSKISPEPRHSKPIYDEEMPSEIYRATVADALATEDYMSPSRAFQESLFDAMADDEGAAYWEGVYGQPIHVYVQEKVGPEGEFEKMTDEEYATYVRGRMYEKTHPHIVEERERREEARKKRREERERQESGHAEWENEDSEFQRRVERSLRRDRERKKSRSLEEAWVDYEKRWIDLKNRLLQPPRLREDATEDGNMQDEIPWPVDSLKRRHVCKEQVEAFMRHVRENKTLSAVLKTERVKWHPDKMKQRFGARGLTDEVLASVTAVFQILDDMWRELQEK